MIDRPGVYDLSDADYFADPCPEPSFSAGTGQTLLLGTAEHAAWDHPRLGPTKEAEDEETDTGKFDIGRAAHALHTGKGGELVEISPVTAKGEPTTSKNAASWKEPAALARSLGRTPLLPAEMKRVTRLVERSREQLIERFGSDPFSNPENNELTIAWQSNGVWCRCKPDALDLDNKIAWDLKTVGGYARAQSWAESQDRMNYVALRAAHYLDGLHHTMGPGWRYRFWLVETRPPHCAVAVELPGAWLDRGDDQRKSALREFAHCLATGRWKGWAHGVVIVDDPAYAEGKWVQARDNRPTEAALEMAREMQAPR